MRFISLSIGSLFLAVALLGLGVLAIGPADQLQLQASRWVMRMQSVGVPAGVEVAGVAVEAPDGLVPGLPISRIRVAQIGLDTEVVPAKMIEVAGGRTWQVPAHKAGHAEYTAGAGEAGNAVLLGHVSSINDGSIFKELGRVKAGDRIQVLSGDQEFEYTVIEARSVARTELSILEPTEAPVVTLITCTGTWLPQVADYSHRYIVRAELAQ